jgi:hypothetical protein
MQKNRLDNSRGNMLRFTIIRVGLTNLKNTLITREFLEMLFRLRDFKGERDVIQRCIFNHGVSTAYDLLKMFSRRSRMDVFQLMLKMLYL